VILSWKVDEELPPCRTGDSNENEASRAVPRNPVEGVEVVGNGRNSCGHDTLRSVGVSVVHFGTHVEWKVSVSQAPYQIQSGNHSVQVDGHHDGGQPERCGILNVVVVKVTLRSLALGLLVFSHGRRAMVLGVLLCAAVLFNKISGGRKSLYSSDRSGR
jgi:hypothetical protein